MVHLERCKVPVEKWHTLMDKWGYTNEDNWPRLFQGLSAEYRFTPI
jgi:hypothetical protein